MLVLFVRSFVSLVSLFVCFFHRYKCVGGGGMSTSVPAESTSVTAHFGVGLDHFIYDICMKCLLAFVLSTLFCQIS